MHQLLAFLCLALVVTSPLHAQESDPPMPERWIVDTDMGYDDWLALLYILKHPRAEVVAISVSGSGAGRCPGVGRGAADLVALAGHDPATTPVACGPDHPLEGFHSFPSEWRNLGDEWLGVAPPSSGVEPDPRGAAQMLTEVLVAANEPVAILALGPMTNLALALAQAPEIERKIKEIVFMGGAVHVPGNIRVEGFTFDVPNTVSEWNVFVDPVAAREVFATGIPIRLVSLDVTNHAPITQGFVESFIERAGSGPLSEWVAGLFETFFDPEAGDIGEYYFWDPLAAAVALDRTICSYHYVPIAIESATAESGWRYPGTENDFPEINWQGEPRRHLATATAGQTMPVSPDRGRWVLMCSHPNRLQLEHSFMRHVGRIDLPELGH